VSELFEDYKKLQNDSCEKVGVTSIDTSNEDDMVISSNIEILHSYLLENVTSKEQLMEVFSKAKHNKETFAIAKQVEPFGVYYEKIANLLMKYIPKGGLFIPEYFGLLLIHLYKGEHKRSFKKFPFIDDFKLDTLLAIYEKVNINLKKEYLHNNPNKRIWEHRTVIDTMEKVAPLLLKEYLNFQYKVNIMRKSKTRKKRK